MWIYDEPIFYRLNEFEIEEKSSHILEVEEKRKTFDEMSAQSQAESLKRKQKFKDIDFIEKTLSISKSMYYKNAEEFYITEPKTSASNRIIAIDDNTLEHLRQWKEIQDKNIPSKYVLSYNGLPTNKHAPKHIIDRHSKLANVHRIKTHALRHSHASLLISLGENALIIRDRLGHEDIQTTLGTYGHLYPNTNKDVARKLTNLIQISEQPNIERKFISNQHIRNHE